MHAVMGAGRLIAGRYRLQDPIGRGAMGIVWRGRDELLARTVAVKEIQVSALASAADAEVIYQRTLREARTAARLNHPSVVTVFDVVEEDGSPWIVMELIDARSLDRVITEDGPLPPEQAADLGIGLVGALATAHAAGVLHRDVKPSNVLVAEDGRAVLTDFGIATFAEDLGLTQSGMVVGTPGFTAPERIRGDVATPASDLWSLGATLYAAVEGRGPFDRTGGWAVIAASVASEDAPRAPSAGPLEPVIEALLLRDPAARPDVSTAVTLLARAADEARTGPQPLSRGWHGAEALAAGTESGQAPMDVWPGAAHSGFLDPPDYGVLQIPRVAVAGEAAGIAASATAPFAQDSFGIVDPASGPVPWAPAMTPATGERQLFDESATPAGPDQDLRPADPDIAMGGAGSAGRSSAQPWRFSRRGRLLSTVASIAALAVVALIAWNAFQSPGTTAALGSQSAAGVAGAGASSRPDPSAATHPGSGGSGPAASAGAGAGSSTDGSVGKPSASASPGSSATTTPSPSPTASPSPTSTGPTLPADWRWHRFTATAMGTLAGFKMGLPDAWIQTIVVPVAHFTQVADDFHLVVNLSGWRYALPLREAQYLAAQAAASHTRGFHLIGLTAANFTALGGYRSAAAARLEYSWKTAVTGAPFTELVYLVSLPTSAGVQPYEFALWAPSGTFAAADTVLQAAMPTFRPLPG